MEEELEVWDEVAATRCGILDTESAEIQEKEEND